jgi:hypothetical protein
MKKGNLAYREYLHLPVRLFVAMLGSYNPLVGARPTVVIVLIWKKKRAWGLNETFPLTLVIFLLKIIKKLRCMYLLRANVFHATVSSTSTPFRGNAS